MKKFYFGQSWEMYGTNSVEVPDDFTIEQAIECVKKNWKDIGLTGNAVYVTDSDKPDFECCGFEETDEKSIAWEEYIRYLHDWADSHADKSFGGMTPSCFNDWYENEYGEDAEDE